MHTAHAGGAIAKWKTRWANLVAPGSHLADPESLRQGQETKGESSTTLRFFSSCVVLIGRQKATLIVAVQTSMDATFFITATLRPIQKRQSNWLK